MESCNPVTEADSPPTGQGRRRKSKGICSWIRRVFGGERELVPREFRLGHPTPIQYTPNLIKNQKYNFITFFPIVIHKLLLTIKVRLHTIPYM